MLKKYIFNNGRPTYFKTITIKVKTYNYSKLTYKILEPGSYRPILYKSYLIVKIPMCTAA